MRGIKKYHFPASLFVDQKVNDIEMEEVTAKYEYKYKEGLLAKKDNLIKLSLFRINSVTLKSIPRLVPTMLNPGQFCIQGFINHCRSCIITESEVSEMAELLHNKWMEEVIGKSEDKESAYNEYPDFLPFEQLPHELRLLYNEFVYLIPITFKNAGFEIIRKSEAEFVNYETADKLARVIHARYWRSLENKVYGSKEIFTELNLIRETTHHVPKNFDDLSEEIKLSNLDNAYHIPSKLLSIGYKIQPWTEMDIEIPLLELTDLETETMARIEHDRWSWERRLAGVVYSEKRDDAMKHHNCLVPFDDLSEKEKEKDRILVRLIPSLLRDIGLYALPVNTELYENIPYVKKDWGCISELKTSFGKLKTVLPGEITQELKCELENVDISIDNIKSAFASGRKVQNCFLPSVLQFKELLPDSFVLFKPKDIVSGDFYFISKVGELIIISAADCTGHSISAAILTAICYNYLDFAVRLRKITDPSKILKFVLPRIENFLRHDFFNESAHFGMDFSVCSLDIRSNTLRFSGFGNPLYYLQEGELKSIKGIPSILNFRQARKDISTYEIKMNKGDSFYIFSDGFADQAGAENRKFMPRRFRELLLKIRDMQSYEQCEVLNRTIEEWRRSSDIHQVQTDDILVIGVKI